MDLSFYRNKKVLVTGHTGFKGAWMCEVLLGQGADVYGYALEAPTDPSLFDKLRLNERMHSVIGDIRDLKRLAGCFAEIRPEIVIHMAAQPIVREAYKNPVYTYETNVMGTVHVLECIRKNPSVRSFVNVTTDKVYKNREWDWGYRENEELDGFDPYSNSKSCSELVTGSYRNSFFSSGERRIAISTCRAGNVIGGGDFAVDRIIPDCIRAAEAEREIIVRNPGSTRPYQHVLEAVIAYLMVAQAQYEDSAYAGSYNVGPSDADCWTTGRIVDLFCREWNRQTGEAVSWKDQSDGGPHEATLLKLDCTRLAVTFGWKPRWDVETAVRKIIEWEQCSRSGGDVIGCTREQIAEYLSGSVSRQS
jgi:CDP-glucose 4,6-dehydratase